MKILLLGFLVPIGASILYLRKCGELRPFERILCSYHGFGMFVAFAYTNVVSQTSLGVPDSVRLGIFFLLMVLSVFSIIHSLFHARVKWYIHLFHLWTLATGTMLFYLAPIAIEHSAL